MVGQLGEMAVLGLPGNPVSSLVCAFLFLEPLTRKLARLPARDRLTTAHLASPLPANDKRQDYVRARLSSDTNGSLIAHPFPRQDSSMMKVFAQSDCLIVRAPNAEAAPAGTSCQIIRLR
ncbi:hypothetical protein D9M68_986870 [compost metagenome]